MSLLQVIQTSKPAVQDVTAQSRVEERDGLPSTGVASVADTAPPAISKPSAAPPKANVAKASKGKPC